jgi:hypothetical protein
MWRSFADIKGIWIFIWSSGTSTADLHRWGITGWLAIIYFTQVLAGNVERREIFMWNCIKNNDENVKMRRGDKNIKKAKKGKGVNASSMLKGFTANENETSI